MKNDNREIEMRHKKWNISYPIMQPAKLVNLNSEQAANMADYINRIVRLHAETDFLLGCYDNKWEIPEELKFAPVNPKDYEEKIIG